MLYLKGKADQDNNFGTLRFTNLTRNKKYNIYLVASSENPSTISHWTKT